MEPLVRRWRKRLLDDVYHRHAERCVGSFGPRVGLSGLRRSFTAQSNHADARDVVHFATMHRAKGLEFDAVAVVAPGSFFGDPESTADQRKLLYVALTRAKRSAVLVKVH